jgi:hypothetical protein
MSFWNDPFGPASPETPASRQKVSSTEVADSGTVLLKPGGGQHPHDSPLRNSLSRSHGALKINQRLLRDLEEASRLVERSDHGNY